MLRPDRVQSGLFLAIILVLAGYFMVWLPHKAAGLSYIGLEMGELAKFLPQVRAGLITPGRSLFYVPPVAAGAVLLLLSSRWPNDRWQTWAMRFLAAGVSFLAFPALEALGTEPEEWLWRALMIGVVLILVIASPFLARAADRAIWAAIGLLALLGAILPGWVFWEVKSAFSTVHQQQMGTGIGFWLHLAGQLLLVALSLWKLRQGPPGEFKRRT